MVTFFRSAKSNVNQKRYWIINEARFPNVSFGAGHFRLVFRVGLRSFELLWCSGQGWRFTPRRLVPEWSMPLWTQLDTLRKKVRALECQD